MSPRLPNQFRRGNSSGTSPGSVIRNQFTTLLMCIHPYHITQVTPEPSTPESTIHDEGSVVISAKDIEESINKAIGVPTLPTLARSVPDSDLALSWSALITDPIPPAVRLASNFKLVVVFATICCLTVLSPRRPRIRATEYRKASNVLPKETSALSP